MRLMWDSNTERNDATAPKIKAGAADCDITSCSWSIVRLDNIATSEPMKGQSGHVMSDFLSDWVVSVSM
jgi:hypothetical protein